MGGPFLLFHHLMYLKHTAGAGSSRLPVKHCCGNFLYNNTYCPGKEAALVIIVVSLPYTAYHCGSLIVL